MHTEKHSPLLDTPPLHNPGQSLDEKIQDDRDNLYVYLSTTMLLCFFAGMEWVRYFSHTLPSFAFSLFLTCIALLGCIYYGIRFRNDLKGMKKKKLGRDGEMFVGQHLEQLRAMGYDVFHDIDMVVDNEKRENIDHVIVGPAGVFTIETKTRSKPNGACHIERDGDVIKIDEYPNRKIIPQVRRQSRWMEGFVLKSTGIKIQAKPAVLFPGWFTESHGSDIWILNEKSLPKFLENEPTRLDTEKIGYISAQLTLWCRRKVA